MALKTAEHYRSKTKPTWCKDCGDYKVLETLTAALAELELEPHDIVLTAGVGCASRLPFYTNSYGFHTVHGRALPAAIGIKIANRDRTVLSVGGDGDGFSIGGNHFIHASRKNPDLTYIIMDNEIYGLTKGQNSPTSHEDLLTKINPYEVVEERINPVLMALSFNTSFIARGFCDDQDQLKDMIVQAVKHKGFSFVHVLSPCTQYNQKVTYESLRKRIKQLPDGHDTSDRIISMKYALTQEPLYMGIFYKNARMTLNDKLEHLREISYDQIGNPSEYSLKDVIKQFE
ncbi:MAG TPA: thiamine pyrophosphate-dependent enzyme [Candidatus Gastranaerophilales bacterium]|nr:thiamine pyrophosphate-dependent enzyme [Candidatus Gastranaerophilales bacterium]